jgi:putative transposase
MPTPTQALQGCPGKIRYVAGACPINADWIGYFLVVETQKGSSMRYSDSIFGNILKPISRRWFDGVVERHGGNAYDKKFGSWDHLVSLIYAQLSGITSLRALTTTWNANAHHHYHLGVGEIARSTLADANARRPLAIFSETFAKLSTMANRQARREGDELLRLIDSSPIPLGKVVSWAKENGRIRGLKLHVVYDPVADTPTFVDVTDTNVNDIGRKVPILAGHTYVFDKGYCRYTWWTDIDRAGARFVTRQKVNARFRAQRWRDLGPTVGEGFTIVDDAEVKLTSKGDSRLPIAMRRIRVRRDDGSKISLITNDLERSAVEIAALYKARWQIELLFRWIKQHLKIRTFLGRNPNAIRLQLIAAMIAYLLLRIAARLNSIKISIIRFVDLVAFRLFCRIQIADIDKPNRSNPSRAAPRHSPNQLAFAYA